MSQHVNEFVHRRLNVMLNVFAQVGLVLFVVAVVLWTVLFTNYPPVHDFFHELRHGLYVIPCH